MALFGCIVFVLTCVCYCLAAVRYDQSQTGDYNIHIDLKNIEVLAILGDGAIVGEYDDYDYDQLTESPKPPHPDANSTYLTPNLYVKPETASLTAGCSNYTATASKNNATEEKCTNSTESSSAAGNGSAPTTTTSIDVPKPTSASNYTTSNASTTAPATVPAISPDSIVFGVTSTSKPVKRCGSGFYRDVLGRCRRIRRPYIPLLGLGYPPRATKSVRPSKESETPLPQK